MGQVRYLCTEDVNLNRGGEFLCVAFTKGVTYAALRFEYRDAVMINNAGGEHLIPPKMLAKQFKKVEGKQP